MTLPGLGPTRDPGDVARVKARVADLIDDHDVTVLVTELTCSEPGCPPIETVIALLAETGNVRYTIHKPVAEVDRDDVHAAVDTSSDRR